MVNIVSLENQAIEKAKSLLIALDKSTIKPNSFFWFYLPDNQVWRLVISSQYFSHKSIKESYEAFINELKENVDVKDIGFENITLLEPNHDLIKLLKLAIRTGAEDISGIRFKSNTINNVYINDAYIYRLS